MALTGQSCPSPSSLSPCPKCASLALSTSGINPCSPSPAPNQSLLLLDAHRVSPGVARHSHCLSRCLPGLLRCCHRLPPELFRAGPAPSPAPARRLRYSCEIQSLVPLRDAGAPGPPSHRPAGPPGSRWPSVGSQPSGKAVYWCCPSGLTPSQLLRNGNQGLILCLCFHCPLHSGLQLPQAPFPAAAGAAQRAVPAWHCWTTGQALMAQHARHSGKGLLATARLTVTGINY